jgi:hypothetical protein
MEQLTKQLKIKQITPEKPGELIPPANILRNPRATSFPRFGFISK